MSWREDHLWELAHQTVGDGPEWMGGKFGKLVTKVLRVLSPIVVIVCLTLWVLSGGLTAYIKSWTSSAPASAETKDSKGAF